MTKTYDILQGKNNVNRKHDQNNVTKKQDSTQYRTLWLKLKALMRITG